MKWEGDCEWEMLWKKAAAAYLRNVSGVLPKGLRKTTVILS
jgi:hypothetical protein